MSFIEFWLTVSSLASGTLLFPVSVLLLIYFLYRRSSKEALLILLGFYGGVGLNYFLKRMFQRARPDDALLPIGGYAFPSGHAMTAAIFYSLLILLFSKEIKKQSDKIIFIISNIIIILLVGLSRVMLKVHYLSDVIGGYIIGMLWLLLIYKLLQRISSA